MTSKIRNHRWILSLALLLALSFAGMGSALAANACKGLSQSKCGSSSSCSWVDGYTTKKGTKVSSYCRAKSSKSKGAGESNKSDKAKSSTSKEKSEKKDKSESKSKSETKEKSDSTKKSDTKDKSSS